MASKHYTRLTEAQASFDEMIQRFGVVTVMDKYTADQICNILAEEAKKTTDHDAAYLCKLDTLKTSNITEEGPTKTVTGGQNSSPLLKFGKTARLEMQDALGNAEALEALGGMTIEYEAKSEPNVLSSRFAVHASDTYGGPKTLLGTSFFINQKNGAQVPVEILIYQFLPDSIFNLSQDAEGDATVFDINGDLISTKVALGDNSGNPIKKNLFYSILKENIGHQTEEEPTKQSV